MSAGWAVQQDQVMTRLIVLWEHPASALADEVEAMVRWQVEKVVSEHAIRGATVTRLEPVRDRSAWYGWLLELHLEAEEGAPDEVVVNSQVVSDMLAELRTLRLNPVALAANRSPAIAAPD